jgi:hypothetical protein
MAKVPDSNKSESWTARVPNDLAALARDKANDLGMVNNLGKPNTTLIIHAALKAWLELPNDISNSVSNNTSNDLSYGVIQILESRLDELSNAISNTVKREELETFKTEILQDVELMIANSGSSQAVVNPAIATPEIRHNQLDLTDIPEVENLGTIVPVSNPDAAPYPIGKDLSLFELAEHLGFHYRMYTKYASDLGQSPDEYINQKAIAKGESWTVHKVGVKKIATRIS